MARFRSAEAEIVALAEAMETRLAANVAIYPALPVGVVDRRMRLSFGRLLPNAWIG